MVRMRYGFLTAPSPKAGTRGKGSVRSGVQSHQGKAWKILDGYPIMHRFPRKDSGPGRCGESWVKREYWIQRPHKGLLSTRSDSRNHGIVGPKFLATVQPRQFRMVVILSLKAEDITELHSTDREFEVQGIWVMNTVTQLISGRTKDANLVCSVSKFYAFPHHCIYPKQGKRHLGFDSQERRGSKDTLCQSPIVQKARSYNQQIFSIV